MVRLPDELLEQVAEHLEADRLESKDPKAAQGALSRLAQTDKRLHGRLSAILYAQPFLSSPKAVELYFRTFTSLVEPWTRARAGRHWPPRVMKPEQLRIDFETEDESFTLPDIPAPALELELFSNLTVLVVSSCAFGSGFLPPILASKTSLRTSILELHLLDIPCLDHDYADTLAFLFEAYEVTPFDWIDSPNVEAGWDVLRLQAGDNCSEPEDPDENWDEMYEAVHEASHTNWAVFSAAFGGCSWTCPFPSFYSNSPWQALRSLSFPLTHLEQLCLVFQSASFPCLKKVVLGEGMLVKIDVSMFELLRRSISHGSGSSFLPPCVWNSSELSRLCALVGSLSPFDIGESLPPLTQLEKEAQDQAWKTIVEEEGDHWDGYNGLDLEVLDMTEADVEVAEEL